MRCSDKFAYLLVVAACTVCSNSSAQGIRIFLDDQLDFELLSTKTRKPENIAGATNELVLSQIKDIDIHYVKSSRKRAFKSIQQTQVPSCIINMIKNEPRKLRYLFSLPVNFYWAHKLYSHHDLSKASKAVLNAEGEITSLPDLFKVYDSSAIVIAESFSYGDFLDAQISVVNKENIILRGGADHYETVYRMFISKRVDFSLNYPSEFHRYSNNINIPVRSYRVAGSPKVVIGQFMCNKTPESSKFIARVNEVLLQSYDKEAFLKAHYDYLQASEHKKLKAYIEQYVAPFQRARH
ncbi:hypothetical protein [Pseudoalteromonas obscura]|uniref:Solute-binding protein family 3/N-terminal domain-containing protein n=1 Tax=Pseudoalteromonas obscura TaxID=3048491 RepID=A0ABT7ENQ6_9GAMM|nr:hypothetical protein [Pseudoalteromonas sp. P94(2023)]MDK2596630.1 hypothetical protein [Pseudoalteromonas sp. P94(2023)]